MGYLAIAILFVLIISAIQIFYMMSSFGEPKQKERTLKVTIPEGLDYTGIFDDLFEEYLISYEQQSVKTVNMGSMYEIDYLIEQKDKAREKEMIDAIRCRNGNLTIVCRRMAAPSEQL